MKIAFIGCVESSYVLLESLLNAKKEVCCVITLSNSKINSDFRDLSDLKKQTDAPFLVLEKNDEEKIFHFLRLAKPDVIYCFGWSYLLSKKILSIPQYGSIGFHPTLLPANRGRHPIIWAIFLGLKETGSTFFYMEEGADAGDILEQAKIVIDDNEDASTLYKKILNVAKLQVVNLTTALEAGNLKRTKQNASFANSWRKRGPLDGIIDWRMSSAAIERLVRSLTKPYVGADIILNNQKYKVWRVAKSKQGEVNDEPGKVLRIKDNMFTVKCYDGAIDVINHELLNLPIVGDYL